MSDQTNFGQLSGRSGSPRTDEQGFVLLTTLLIMVLLALLGLASTSSTIMELQIAANDREYKRNFFRAEGASMETAQLLENEQDPEQLIPDLTTESWIQAKGKSKIPDNWDESASPANNRLSSLDDLGSDIRLAAVAVGVAKGSSLGMNEPKANEFRLYGRSRERNGQVIIAIGYRKFF